MTNTPTMSFFIARIVTILELNDRLVFLHKEGLLFFFFRPPTHFAQITYLITTNFKNAGENYKEKMIFTEFLISADN